MKLYVTNALLNLEGQRLTRPVPGKGSDGKPVIVDEPLTVRFCFIECLLNRDTMKPGQTAEDSLKRWVLAQRLLKDAEVDLNKEEAALIEAGLDALSSPTDSAGRPRPPGSILFTPLLGGQLKALLIGK